MFHSFALSPSSLSQRLTREKRSKQNILEQYEVKPKMNKARKSRSGIHLFLAILCTFVLVVEFNRYKSTQSSLNDLSNSVKSQSTIELEQKLASATLANAAYEWEKQVSAPSKKKVAIASMIWGKNDYSAQLQRALTTHKKYAKRHGYDLNILERPIYDLIWSKPAYMLQLILKELAKPEEERLEWIVWADIDTLIMNPNVPLESFLPPRHMNEVNLMTTNDVFGLNNGVFFIRVNAWAVKLLSHAIAFPYFNPKVVLGNADQSAMLHLLEDRQINRNAIILPQHFFNGYRLGMGEGENSRPGALIMHFPGGNKQFMQEFIGYIEGGHNSTWNIPYEQTTYADELKEFWDQAFRRKLDGLPLYIASDV